MNLSGLLPLVEEAPSLRHLKEELRRDGVRLTLGVGDAAKAAVIACLARGQAGLPAGRQGPVLIIVPREDKADGLVEELAVWLGPDFEVLPFPERDALPYERLAPEPEAVRDRLGVISRLNSGRAVVIVASVRAVAQRTLSPQELRAATRTLEQGQDVQSEAFLRELAALGYALEPLVERVGQASRRGGIIDVFPSTTELPVRIELLGRQIESLREFDPANQRSVRPIESTSIGPAREMMLGQDTRHETRDTLGELDFSRCSPEVRERFREELSQLAEGAGFPADHFYVSFLARSTLLEHFPPGGPSTLRLNSGQALVIIDEESDLAAALEEYEEQAEASRRELEEKGEIPRGLPLPQAAWPELRRSLEGVPRLTRLSRWATGEEPGALRLPFAPATAYGGQLRRLVSETASQVQSGRRVIVVSQQAQRLAELLSEQNLDVPVLSELVEPPTRLGLVHGSLSAGWQLAEGELHLTLITDAEVFGFVKQKRAAPRQGINREAFLAQLSPGEYVVHVDHGVARFAGLVRLTMDGHEREYLELHYAEGDKLFVPADQVERVSRYVGPSDHEPRLTRLGSGDWQRAKRRVRGAVQALAKDLLALYAAREALPGYAYPPDHSWQAEMEASFPYVETQDQLAAIAEVKGDLERPRPMDRLVCGDVGYGKTEVAIRAAFKTVLDGRQAAVLVPTTVLAQQHYQTFSERLAAFPVRVEVLSRFRSEAEQRQVAAGLQEGSVDIVIGTHRLLQKDVRFKDLGLVVIDEEQRFGVAHKEHLKQLRREVDVLTLSATPIPRTLYMALGGIRDMSTMETPPEERLPIRTYVSEFDERLVREAIVRELERGGQVYFVHNRVHNIDLIAQKVQEIVPEATVAIAHGQMDEQLLERTMMEFVQGRIDVLACTTIIESGLDIPNVNTIIINQADKLGLGQLYQLRGRVGRGAHRAYAYLLYDRRARLTEAAQKRLQTIFEARELGSGFQIALRDLEIRGAGNLLGAEQSGFMAVVGFDLYCRLLAEAVERLRALLRGEPPPPQDEGPGITIDLPLSAHLPQAYVPDLNLRLALYQRLSEAGDPQQVSEIGQEMVDRFGEPPPLARSLLYVALLRALAARANVQSIAMEDSELVIRLKEGELVPREALEGRAAKGVQVGRTLLKLELGEGWRERLRKTLEELVKVGAGVKTENQL